ncbi:MAG: hypothetical protein IJS55_03225 [Oscillospiraceae bacterium]|nr:hypothetical protein [Oscillospiraceae bacterium]
MGEQKKAVGVNSLAKHCLTGNRGGPCVYKGETSGIPVCDYCFHTGLKRPTPIRECKLYMAESQEAILNRKDISFGQGKERKKGSTRTADMEKRLMALYEAGLDDPGIAKETGITASAVHLWRHRKGLPSQREVTEARRLELYRQGYTDKDMAQAEGISVCRAANWRKGHKLKANIDTAQKYRHAADMPPAEEAAPEPAEPAPEEESAVKSPPSIQVAAGQAEDATVAAAAPAGAERKDIPEATRRYMTAATIAEILGRFAKGWPDGVVIMNTTGGSIVRNCSVTVDYGPDGKERTTVLVLEA